MSDCISGPFCALWICPFLAMSDNGSTITRRIGLVNKHSCPRRLAGLFLLGAPLSRGTFRRFEVADGHAGRTLELHRTAELGDITVPLRDFWDHLLEAFMGYFSWRTADTKRSIRLGSQVFLLQPGGEPSIAEACYGGYGRFGDVDACFWLALKNLPANQSSSMSDDDLRDVGLSMLHGEVFRDTRTGELWSIFKDRRLLVGGRFFAGTFSDSCEEWRCSPAAAIEAGILERVPVSSIFEIRFPLKFSFSPDQIYERLPASKICDKQGFF